MVQGQFLHGSPIENKSGQSEALIVQLIIREDRKPRLVLDMRSKMDLPGLDTRRSGNTYSESKYFLWYFITITWIYLFVQFNGQEVEITNEISDMAESLLSLPMT